MHPSSHKVNEPQLQSNLVTSPRKTSYVGLKGDQRFDSSDWPGIRYDRQSMQQSVVPPPPPPNSIFDFLSDSTPPLNNNSSEAHSCSTNTHDQRKSESLPSKADDFDFFAPQPSVDSSTPYKNNSVTQSSSSWCNESLSRQRASHVYPPIQYAPPTVDFLHSTGTANNDVDFFSEFTPCNNPQTNYFGADANININALSIQSPVDQSGQLPPEYSVVTNQNQPQMARKIDTTSQPRQNNTQKDDGYKFGDITRSIIAKGKTSSGRKEDSSYRFGKFNTYSNILL
jgi:hypothetical protein